MIRHLLFLVLVFDLTLLSAQVRLVDKNLEGISGVFLMCLDEVVGISDNDGMIDVDLNLISSDKLVLSHEHFYTKVVSPLYLKKQTTIILTKKVNSFSPVVVSAGRTNTYQKNKATFIQKIEQKNIELIQPQTAADLLSLDHSVYVQKSQQGGGSPMIRGFATSRILLVVDGVRMNSAIFRSGNVQNVISIDPFTIESTDLIFGPSSQFYGSDAIGGVLSFNTVKPLFCDTGTHIDVQSNIRYSSVNNERTVHTQFGFGTKRWASHTSISYNQFSNLTMGKKGPILYTRPTYVAVKNGSDTTLTNPNINEQLNSGYNQKNILQKISFKPNTHTQIDYGFIYSKTSDIPRYDRLLLKDETNQFINAEWYYGPQGWMMNNFSIEHKKKHGLFDEFKAIIAHQQFTESRNTRTFNSSHLNQRSERVVAYSLNTDFAKFVGTKTQINYGLEIIKNNVYSEAKQLNIITQSYQSLSTRYPNNSEWNSAGAYLNIQQRWNNLTKTEGGFRVNTVRALGNMDTTYINHPLPSFDLRNQAITGSISQLFKLKYGSVGVVFSSAFRAPNIDDIAKTFDSNPGFVTIPNAQLNPEYAYNAEINLKYLFLHKIKIQNSTFYTFLDQAISLDNAKLNGTDSIVYDSRLSQIQMLTNNDYATMIGNQFSMHYLINEQVSIKSSYTILSNISNSGAPIRHITPNFGGTTLYINYQHYKLALYSIYNQTMNYNKFSNAEKNRKQFYALDNNGNPYSPTWVTFNTKISYTANKSMILNLGVENIFDKRYRPYGSRISAPGRNFIFAMHISL